MALGPDVLAPGAIVVIATFDDIPKHLFLIEQVFEDIVTGVALTGPLKGAYGEPDQEMILEIVYPTLEAWLREHRKP
jgi:hypothetical protein